MSERNFWMYRMSNENSTIKEKLLQELFDEGKARQGWGLKGMAFVDGGENQISCNNWIKKCQNNNHIKENWKNKTEEDLEKIYNKLKDFFRIKVGDFLVIPKYRNSNEFILAKVKEGYNFDKGILRTESDLEHKDFIHYIEIEKDSLKRFHVNDLEIPWAIEKMIKSRAYSYPISGRVICQEFF